MKESEDIKLRIQCDCHDPWHFVHFWFWYEESDILDDSLFNISCDLYHGGIFRRIRNAFKYIIGGGYSAKVDLTLYGKEKIELLHKFTEDCLNKYK